MKKDGFAYKRAHETLKREGFNIGKDNLYHHEDGRTVHINSKTGYYEEAPAKKSPTGKTKSAVVGPAERLSATQKLAVSALLRRPGWNLKKGKRAC